MGSDRDITEMGSNLTSSVAPACGTAAVPAVSTVNDGWEPAGLVAIEVLLTPLAKPIATVARNA